MEELIQGKHFSITDPQNVNTVIYQVNKTEKEFAKNAPKYTIERLEFTEEFVGEKKRKTFYVNKPKEEGNDFVILSFGKEKVVVNTGKLEGNVVKICKKPIPMKLDSIYGEEEIEKEIFYTPNFKRPIAIIDPVTTEEIRPILYFDEKTNEIRGKCKLKPHKNYFTFEIRTKK